MVYSDHIRLGRSDLLRDAPVSPGSPRWAHLRTPLEWRVIKKCLVMFSPADDERLQGPLSRESVYGVCVLEGDVREPRADTDRGR